jgi:hypothetical protein
VGESGRAVGVRGMETPEISLLGPDLSRKPPSPRINCRRS